MDFGRRVQIFAFHSVGFLEISPETIQNNGILRLEPWGHVEGSVSYRGRTATGAMVSLHRIAQYGAHFNVTGKAGPDGKFRFERVPAGKFSLYAAPDGKPIDWTDFYRGSLGKLEVQAGETTRVEF